MVFWLVAFWGAREVLGLTEDEGSKQECSQAPEGWNPVNKNLFPSTLIVGSRVKVPVAEPSLFGNILMLQISEVLSDLT